MIYHRLLLNNKGGILSPGMRSTLLPGYNTLVLGLGGVGVDALSVFRGKMRRRVCPVNGRYPGVSVLGIDSDIHNRMYYQGECYLPDEEYFDLWGTAHESVCPSVVADSRFDWLSEEAIRDNQRIRGTGAVRQIGRAMLMRRVWDLRAKLDHILCEMVMHSIDTRIRVHLVTGLGGGTGSGIYADVCYILRRIAAQHGWHLDIQGYFLLQDFEEARIDQARYEHMSKNCYAALRELEYLMDLPAHDDWFHQIYMDGFMVHTQEPPTNVTYLINGTDILGHYLPHGYNDVMEMLSDHLVEHLIDPGLWYQVPRPAEKTYRLLGCHVAEVPKTEIMTLMTVGLVSGLSEKIGGVQKVAQDETMRFAAACGLEPLAILTEMEKQLPSLELPEISLAQLRADPMPGPGVVEAYWLSRVRGWYQQSKEHIQKWVRRQRCGADEPDPEKADTATLIGRLFQALYGLCKDPKYGIDYVRDLLSDSGLIALVEHQRSEVQHRREQTMQGSKALCNEMMALREQITRSIFGGSAARREEYRELTERLHRYEFRFELLAHIDTYLKDVVAGLLRLRRNFFQPMYQHWDALRRTCDLNAEWLEYAVKPETVALLRRAAGERLERMWDKVPEREALGILVDIFAKTVTNDELDPVPLIREAMRELFRDVDTMSVQSYLTEYTGGDPAQYRQLLRDVYRKALPTIRIRDSQLLHLPQETRFNHSGADPQLTNEITNFCAAVPHCIQGMLPTPGRLAIHQIVKGVQLKDLPQVAWMIRAVDQRPFLAGSYLYEATDRGGVYTGNISWRDLLPPIALPED